MPRCAPGEVWLVDLGIAAKTRPCAVLSRYPADDELALVVIIPRTTALRGNRWEVEMPLPFLSAGVFHVQQIQPVSLPRLVRRLGSLTAEQLQQLRARVRQELDLDRAP